MIKRLQARVTEAEGGGENTSGVVVEEEVGGGGGKGGGGRGFRGHSQKSDPCHRVSYHRTFSCTL